MKGLQTVLPKVLPSAQAVPPGAGSDAGHSSALAMAKDLLVKGLQTVLPNLVPGVPVTLHGFDPGAGQPRGLALVIAVSPGIALIFALTGDGPTGLAIEISAVGTGVFGPITLPLAPGWSLLASGDIKGGGRLRFPRNGPAAALDGRPPLSVQLTLRHSGSQLQLGQPTQPHVSVADLAVGIKTVFNVSGNPKISWAIDLVNAGVSLLSEDVSSLIGDNLSIPMNLSLIADPELGFAVRGAGLRITLPSNLSVPGVDFSAMDVAVSASGPDVRFSFGIDFSASLPGFPLLAVVASGLGASFGIGTGKTKLGLNLPVLPNMPSGLGLGLKLPVISGGGFLQTTGPGGYGGVLELNLLAVAIKAFGLLQLRVEGRQFSFVAVISAEFPLPGIDLSFGFALAGVGGIVAVNRRLDTDALEAAVVDGSASRLLFPVNPAAHGPAIVATLGRVFTEAEDHIVVGPMLKISWGGRIVSGVVAVVIDLSTHVQFVFLGRITVALPDPLVPLVFIQGTFVGAFELSPTPSVSILASLDGSYMAGMPLNGDIFFLLRGGNDADFVFSAGGFHPRYLPPNGIPPDMHRLQLAMTPPGVPGISAEAYFAVTTNSVQFGAKLELCYEIAGCGVDGWFSFDALFKWDPIFSFSIQASGGVAVQVLRETLMGVSFDLLLDGPAPWHVHGTGSVRLFLFHASLDFDATWGSAPPVITGGKTVEQVLRNALALSSAWIGTPPMDKAPAVSLSGSARALVSSGHTVHPLGSVTARQRAVPFDITISRFQQQLIPPETWSIVSPGVSTRDSFPPGELLDLSEDEKLSRPAFEQWNSGRALNAIGEAHSDLRKWNTDYETSVMPDFTVVPGKGLSRLAVLYETFLAVTDVHQVPALWHPPNREGISVLAAQPVTIATTNTLTQESAFISPGGFTETLQAGKAQFGAVGHAAANQIVETWEVVKQEVVKQEVVKQEVVKQEAVKQEAVKQEVAKLVSHRLFTAWVRRGEAAAITEPDPDSRPWPGPATVKPSIDVTKNGAAQIPIAPQNPLSVLGPGAVTGLNKEVVVRTDPRDGATAVENNYLVQIEFSRPDLPWMFTPAKPNSKNRLRPWLVLIVVEAATAQLQPGTPLPRISVHDSELPDLNDSWGWAHSQVTVDTPAVSKPRKLPADAGDVAKEDADALAKEEADALNVAESELISPAGTSAISRLLCPRRLDPNKTYLACVVPATRQGQQAGLGNEPDAGPEIKQAWEAGSGNDVVLPVYYSWQFSTGNAGDFKSLVTRIRGVPPTDVAGFATRTVDMSLAWQREPQLPAGTSIELGGAFGNHSDGELSDQAKSLFVPRLINLLNFPATQQPTNPEQDPNLSAVAPPIYGGRHAGATSLPTSAGWLRMLNLKPRNRIAAAFGTQYVQENQEFLMAQAWNQLGAVKEANRLQVLAEFASEVGDRMHRRHIAALPLSKIVSMAAPAGTRFLVGDLTLHAKVADSPMPAGAATVAFNRFTRFQGPLARRTFGGRVPAVIELGLRGQLTSAPLLLDGITTPVSLPQPSVVNPTEGMVALASQAVANLEKAIPAQNLTGLVQAANAVTRPSTPVAAAQRLGSPVLRTLLSIGVQKSLKEADSLPVVIADATKPSTGILKRFQTRVRIPDGFETDPAARVMACPQFIAPLALALKTNHPDWLLPGLGNFPDNSATLLNADGEFVESFMAGANHEMNREFLWRGYPTDQRGTPFRHFWPRPDRSPDIPPITNWPMDTLLGKNGTKDGGNVENITILLVRGELLHRYPRLIVHVTPSKAVAGAIPFDEDEDHWTPPDFALRLDDRTTAFAYNLPDPRGVYFVFSEPTTGPRFNFDDPPDPSKQPPLKSWTDLDWGRVPMKRGFAFAGLPPIVEPLDKETANWNTDAADIARIAFARPFRVAYQADKLLTSPGAQA
jgi:hypothetical protein